MAKKHITLTGILTGIPEGTTKPFGKYVYQKTVPGHGNIDGDKTNRQQVRRWVRGTMRNTQAQQIFRKRFALGLGHWQTASESERETWRAPSKQQRLNRFQGFMRAWMQDKNSSMWSHWDAGATIWDSGLTTWPQPEGDVWDSGKTHWDKIVRTAWDAGSTVWDLGISEWDKTETIFDI